MGTDRSSVHCVLAAAALLLWPAVWNGYPIVFADTGTYLSQAIHHYTGWDRPVFYSLFMLPLHGTITVWPVVVVQALLAAWVMWLACRVLVPQVSGAVFVAGVGVLSVCSWLPWIVSELMPDLFTPLLVLVLCLLGWVPERLVRWERIGLVGMAAFMIASQQSSLPLACGLVGVRLVLGWRRDGGGILSGGFPAKLAGAVPVDGDRDGTVGVRRRLVGSWLLLVLPPALAVFGLCSVNLVAHGRIAVSPFGNVFLLARVIYDGPGMAVLRRDCQVERWLLCPFLGAFPPASDDFLWTSDSPLNRAGGPKVVSAQAGAIIWAAILMDPAGEAWAAARNAMEQLRRFDSGDGLTPWPEQVSNRIEHDFPAREFAAYVSAAQQRGILSVPNVLAQIHRVVAIGGIIVCVVLLPVAIRAAGSLRGISAFRAADVAP